MNYKAEVVPTYRESWQTVAERPKKALKIDVFLDVFLMACLYCLLPLLFSFFYLLPQSTSPPPRPKTQVSLQVAIDPKY